MWPSCRVTLAASGRPLSAFPRSASYRSQSSLRDVSPARHGSARLFSVPSAARHPRHASALSSMLPNSSLPPRFEVDFVEYKPCIATTTPTPTVLRPRLASIRRRVIERHVAAGIVETRHVGLDPLIAGDFDDPDEDTPRLHSPRHCRGHSTDWVRRGHRKKDSRRVATAERQGGSVGELGAGVC